MYQNVADDAISAGESANFIISQMKAFGLEAEDATHIIDALNEVSNTQAVSSADLANNLGKASAAMALGNNTYEQSLAMMTAITEINRSGAKSARALVSVQSRLTQVLDEQSSTGKALIEIYDGLGIALKDQNGQLRPTFEIFKDLAEKWPNLTTNQKDYIALTQAGANQTSNFVALMDNFEAALKAEATAMDSAGSAAKENAAYMESLEAQTTQLKATFQDFANNVIDKELVSSALKGLNTALEALNTPIGKTVTQWTLLTGVLTGGITIYGQIAGKLGGIAKTVGIDLVNSFKNLTMMVSGAQGPLLATGTALGTATSAALPFAAALSAIAIVGWEVYKWYKETHKPLQEYTDEIQSNTEQLEKNRDRIAEIEQMSWTDKTPEILDEYDALVQQNEELQRNIDLLEERRRNQAVRQARSGGQVQQGSTYSFDGLSWSTNSEEEAWNTLASTLGMAGASIDEVKEKAKELGYTLQENAVMVKVDADAYNEDLTVSMQNYADQLNSTHGLNQDQLRDYEFLKTEVGERVAGLRQLQAEGETLTNSEQALITAYEQLIQAEADATDFTEKYGEAQKLTLAQVDLLISKFPEAHDQITKVGDAYYYTGNGALNAASSIMDANGDIVADEKATVDAVIAQIQRQLNAYAELVRVKRAVYAGYVKSGQKDSELGRQAEAEWIAASEAWNEVQQARLNISSALATGRVTYSGNRKDTGIGTGASKATKTATKKATDLALEEFKNLQKDLEHQRELGLISEEEYYNKLEQLVKDYKAKATAHMKEYGTDVDTINRNMYQYEEEIYKGRAKLADDLAEQQKKDAEAQKEAAEEAAKAQKEQIEEQKRLAEEREQAFLDMIGYLVSEIDEDIDALNKQLDEIDQRYDDEIAKLEAQNDLIESQVELEEKLNNLAKARSQKLLVYKDGRFQYVSDADAVSAATVELEQYNRKKLLEMQRQDIEDRRDAERADIEATIESLKNKKEAYNKFLDDYQDYKTALDIEQKLGIKLEKDNFNTSLNNLQNYKDEYVSILGGLVSEQKSQLEQLVTDQKAKLEELKLTRDQFNALLKAGYNVNGVYLDPNKDTVFAGAQEEILGGPISDPNYYNPRADYDAAINEVLTSAKLGGYEPWQELLDSLYRQKANQDEARKQGLISGYGSSTIIYGGIGWDSSDNEDYTNWGESGFNNHYHDDDDDGYDDRYQMHTGSTVYQDAYDKYISEGDYESAKEVIEEAEARGQTVNKHASGTLGSAGGLSLVGEKGPELRVLNSGDGIIPADATRNLWDWAKFSPKEFNGGTMIHIANLNLPNVRDGNDFVKYMVNNFWRETVQYAST